MGKRVTRKEVITKKKTTKKKNEELGFRIVINNNGRKKTIKKENKKVIERLSRKTEPKKKINKKEPKSSKKEVKQELDNQQCVDAIFEKIKKQKKKKEKKSNKVKKVEKKTVVKKQRKSKRQSQVKINKQLEPELPLHIPVANLNEISNKAIVDFNVIDIIMSIIEIGKYPQYYNKKNSNPETKSFWDYIIQQSEYRNIFNESNNDNALNLSSDNLRRFFTKVMNIDSIKIVEVIKNNSDYLISNKDSLNLMVIAEYINDIVNGKAKTMNEIEPIEIEDNNEETDEEFTNKFNTVIEAINKDFENVDKQTILQIFKKNNTNIADTYKELQTINNTKNEEIMEEEVKEKENKSPEKIETKIVKEISLPQETIKTDMKIEECIIKEIKEQNEKESEEKMDIEHELY